MILVDKNPVSEEVRKLRTNRLANLPDADIVVVLSGNGTVAEHKQPGSDLHRINTGITAVRMITANRLNMETRNVGPQDIENAGVVFYYNGTADTQNPAMRRFRDSPDCPLPSELIVIEELPDNAQRTGGQAEVFTEYLSRNHSIRTGHKLITTHEYHVPRVSRYSGFQQELTKGRMTFLPVRDPLRRKKLREGECERITTYTTRGDLVEPTIADLPAFYLPRRAVRK